MNYVTQILYITAGLLIILFAGKYVFANKGVSV